MRLPLQASSLAGFKQDKPVVEAIQDRDCVASIHDDVVTCIGFSHYWPFDQWVRLIRGQWRGTLMFYLSLTWKFVDKIRRLFIWDLVQLAITSHRKSLRRRRELICMKQSDGYVVSSRVISWSCYVMFLTPCIETTCSFRGRNRHKTMQSKHLIQIEFSNIMLRGKAILQTSSAIEESLKLENLRGASGQCYKCLGKLGATRRPVREPVDMYMMKQCVMIKQCRKPVRYFHKCNTSPTEMK